MKAKFIALIGAAILPFVPECVGKSIVLSPVGPRPPSEITRLPKGSLQVFSETQTVVDGDQTFYYPHTGYNICNPSGKVLTYIPNHIGTMDQTPSIVNVPPGNYTIRARSSSYGWVTVPVIVQQGRRTVIHLENEWQPSAPADKLVFLPNGEPVGWNASAFN